jgi:2-polyprenyl-6-methoxyphenol hydroxylase-like FAD-dependent oxidoreductase
MALPVFVNVDTLVTPENTLAATISPAVAASRVWDVLIVGAGPAGSVAARELARRGISTLLVDRCRFPRDKVCGSCLSAAGLRELAAIGLGDLPRRLGAPAVSEFRVYAAGRDVRVAVPAGAAVSRRALDAALVESAIEYGAEFLSETTAQLDGIDGALRGIYLKTAQRFHRTRARLVLIADGLGGRSLLGQRGFGRQRWSDSRVGAACLCTDGGDFYRPGAVHMACGRGGYIGLVRLETGQLDVAGAFDSEFMRCSGGPGPAAADVLAQAGLPPIHSLAQQTWHGTSWLTIAPTRVATERLFVLGDAAGYVEPFTGEGMSWAMASARSVIDLAVEAVDAWRPEHADRWCAIHRQRIRQRQTLCRWLARGLRHPRLTVAVITALHRWPRATAPLVWYTYRPLNPG